MDRRAFIRNAGIAAGALTVPTVFGAAPSSAAPTWSAAPGAKGISPGMGYTYWLSAQSAATQRSEFAAMAGAGANGIRFDVGWFGGTNRGGFSDALIVAAMSAGLAPLAILQDWSGAGVVPDYSTNGFIDWTGTIAAHLATLGVHYYEIMNEMNLGANNPGAGGPGRADPVKYSTALKSIYANVHSADPSAFVLHCGLAPYGRLSGGDQGGNWNPFDYFSAMYSNGVKGYFDAANFHPYSSPFSPEYDSPYNTFYHLPDAYATMTQHGDGAKRIVLSEYGWYTKLMRPNMTAPVSQMTQSAWIRTAYTMAKAWPWCGPLLVFSWQDNATDGYFGLRTSSGGRKLAYSTFQSL